MILLALLSIAASSAAQVCGDLKSQAGVESRIVTLPPEPTGFSFYYRTGGYVIYLPPELLVQLLKTEPPSRFISDLDSQIHGRLPLKRNEDLAEFETFINWGIMQSLLKRSIQDGGASILHEGDDWLHVAQLVRRRGLSRGDTIVYDSKRHKTKVIGFLDCIAD